MEKFVTIGGRKIPSDFELPRRPMAGQRPLKPLILVRIQARHH